MSEQRTNKGWNNLKTEENSFALYDRDRLREISRKGAERTHQIVKEKQTARKALERILSMNITDDILYSSELTPELAERLKKEYPDCTLYDLMNYVALGLALSGNVRACEFVRDSYGDKPSSKVEVSNSNITTDEDRQMMQNIYERLNNPNTVIAQDITESEN